MHTIPTSSRLRSSSAPPREAVAGWTPMMGLYCAYLGVALLGFLLGRNFLAVGGVLFVLLIGIIFRQSLRQVPFNTLTVAIVLLCVLPLLALAVNYSAMRAAGWSFFVKHVLFYLLVLLTLPVRLVPLPRCPQRVWAYGGIIAVLVIGMVYAGLTGNVPADARASGLFANPNNFALMALCLLLLIDRASTPAWRWATHGLVVVFLLLSGTAGAIIGYLIGRLYQFLFAQRSPGKAWGLVVLIALTVSIPVVVFRDAINALPPIRAFSKKIEIAVENVPLVLKGREPNYWQLGERADGGVTSGLWRFTQWRKTLHRYRDGTVLQQVFGFGIGTSDLLLETKPHNDFLRMLFELGAGGCLVLLLIWVPLYRRMAPEYRWVFVMLAVYSCTENNVDNFLVACLFALFVTSTATHPWRRSSRRTPLRHASPDERAHPRTEG